MGTDRLPHFFIPSHAYDYLNSTIGIVNGLIDFYSRVCHYPKFMITTVIIDSILPKIILLSIDY